MGHEDLRSEYWLMIAAATEVLQAWDAQQEDADGDWGQMIGAMERLRITLFGPARKKL